MVDPDPEVLWAIKGDLQRHEQLSDAASGLRTQRLWTLKQLKGPKCMTLFVVEQQRSNMMAAFLSQLGNCSRKLSSLLTVYDTNDAPFGSVAKSDGCLIEYPARFFKNILLQRVSNAREA